MVLKVALILLVAWLGWRAVLWVRELVSNRHRPAPRPEHVEFDVLDDPEPLAEEIRRDAADQLALLLGGTPRNAIVACWDRFEEQAERVRAARQPWETSSEFTLRLLDRVSADEAAVLRLEGLYHEARFSDHEIDESRREAAVEALHAIHQLHRSQGRARMTGRRRWLGRVVFAGLVIGVIAGFTVFEQASPQLLPTALLVCAVVAIAGMVLDTGGADPPEWGVSAPSPAPRRSDRTSGWPATSGCWRTT